MKYLLIIWGVEIIIFSLLLVNFLWVDKNEK